jgi:uncharacterized membrane protein
MSFGEEGASALPGPARLTAGAIGRVLKAGFGDFMKAPLFGLFFSAIYVAGGLIIWMVYKASGQEWWLIPVIVGFPLLAPFAAIGLYEVSRRIEAGEPLNWPAVLGVVFAQKDRQIPSMAMVILLMFMFWVFVAHTIFALFMGLQAMTNVTSSFAVLFEGNGPDAGSERMIGGRVCCCAFFASPLSDCRSCWTARWISSAAIIVSFQAVFDNPRPHDHLGVGHCRAARHRYDAPMFLGLFVVLPVLGHASMAHVQGTDD